MSSPITPSTPATQYFLSSLDPSTPIISPSKALRDASIARDWTYVIDWLSRKYHPKPIPTFERNEATLSALLALVASNLAADSRRDLLEKAISEETEELLRVERERDNHDDPTDDHTRGPIVDSVVLSLTSSLSSKPSDALDSIASTSLDLGLTSPTLESLTSTLTGLTADLHALKTQLSTMDSLLSSVTNETNNLQAQLSAIQQSRPAHEESRETMQGQIVDWNRASKLLGLKFTEYRERVAAMDREEASQPPLKIEDLREREKEVLKLKEHVRVLERELEGYQGLPPDVGAARQEYQRMSEEVSKLRRRRDDLFEHMANG